jgi:hypothetical protein
MKFTSLVSLAAFVALAVAQAPDPQVNTPPSLVTCQPSQITFTGTHPPFFLSVIPAGNTAAPPLVDFGTIQSSPFTWNVNLDAGTAVTIHIKDSVGADGYSGQVVIIAGSDRSCVGKPLSSASGASTPPATGPPASVPPTLSASTPTAPTPPVSSAPASSLSSPSTPASPSSAAASGSKSSAAPTPSKNVAIANVPQLGLAVLGMVGAAVLA